MVQEKFKQKTCVEVILPVLTLLLTLTGNFLPQVNATVTGDNWVTDITPYLGVGIRHAGVASDSEGRIYVSTNATTGCVFKSEDYGDTWTLVRNASGNYNWRICL